MFLHQQGPGVDYCGKPLPVRSVGGRWHPFGEIERTRHRICDLQARGARAQEEIAKLKKAYRELDDWSRLILKLILPCRAQILLLRFRNEASLQESLLLGVWHAEVY